MPIVGEAGRGHRLPRPHREGLLKSGRAPVYSYQFNYSGAVPADRRFGEGSGKELGAFHGAEIGFALRTQAALGFALSPAPARLIDTMSGWWVNFARTGTPNGTAPSHWPAYHLGAPNVLHIDADAATPGPLDNRERLRILGHAMGNPILDLA